MSSRVKGYLQDQLERLQRMEQMYSDKIEELPKGKIYPKIISGRQYSYLQYRGRYRSLHPDEKAKLEKLIKEREANKASLKMIQEDIKYIKKALLLK